MGCGSIKTVSIPTNETSEDFRTVIRRVQRTWPMVKKIDNLGPKTFAQ
jgi:hypothetical protein